MNPKQAKFYGEYIKDGNAARAARVACGLTGAAAEVEGARMLRNAKVARAIDAWRARQCEKHEISAERLVLELKKLALFDSGNLYDEDGNQIPVMNLDDFTRAAVASITDESTVTEKATVRRQFVKFTDKLRAIELLGKHLKLFSEDSLRASLTAGADGLAAGTGITVTLVRPG